MRARLFLLIAFSLLTGCSIQREKSEIRVPVAAKYSVRDPQFRRAADALLGACGNRGVAPSPGRASSASAPRAEPPALQTVRAAEQRRDSQGIGEEALSSPLRPVL